MKVPARDIFRLYKGELVFDDNRASSWLDVDPEKIDEQLGRDLLDTEDHTPASVRNAAYFVEARRALMAQINELAFSSYVVVAFLFVFSGSFASSVTFWVASGLVGLALVLLIEFMRRRGNRLAYEAIRWGQPLHPAVWCLYYPVQSAQRVLDLPKSLSGTTETIFERWTELESHVERGADKKALPGSEAAIAALVKYVTTELAEVLGTRQSGRSIGLEIYDRARAAANLVRDEFLLDGGRKTAEGKAGADRIAQLTYSRLLELAERFSALPRPFPVRQLDYSVGQLPSEDNFKQLSRECGKLVESAVELAAGSAPKIAEGEKLIDLPAPPRMATLVVGLILIAGGIYIHFNVLDLPTVGPVISNLGLALLPAALRDVLKPAADLKPKDK